MKKIAISLMVIAIFALPSAAIASEGILPEGESVSSSQVSPGAEIGGNYGTEGCYIAVDYFRADVSISTVRPYVSYTTEGTIGGEVHCEVPPIPPIQK